MSYVFSRTLTKLAKERKLGYEDLADEAQLSRVFVWRMTVGQKNPSYLTIYKLAGALHKAGWFKGAATPEISRRLIMWTLLDAAVKDAVAKDDESGK